ncbi:hypothetical protein F5148DRAFT_1346432 [Russula earlei]|uniref:Uncharacterized protein n=1 Tax=Russula earlei TaxID=71964 RepID=A0ACC0TTS3_9AGAM|nr:hypothetical protein F5148DRAFT_1346432 [Russula earlei]
MKNKKLIWSVFVVTVLFACVTIISCNKKFDEPPAFVNPNVKPNITIAAFKTKYNPGTSAVLITGNDTLSGIVVGDDKSGNIYKQLFIQDASGGICLSLDGTNLYTNYPVGRKVDVVCKGLYIVNKNGFIQLGNIDNTNTFVGIASTLFVNYLIRDTLYSRAYVDSNLAKTVTLAQLTTNNQSMLVRIENAQINTTDTSKTYADTSAAKNSTKINLNDACGNTSSGYMYNSGYANFAGIKVPKGNGTFFGIFVPYNSDKEFMIRDTADVKLYNARCGSTGGTPPPAGVLTVSQLRAMYTGTDVILGSNTTKGIVIANPSNLSAGNLIIQDGNMGIDLYFGSTAPTTNFAVGDSIVLDITGGKLTNYKGMVELSLAAAQLPTAKAGTGKTVTPVAATIAQINSNLGSTGTGSLENIVLQIVSATVSGTGTTYSGNQTLADASGTIVLYTNATYTALAGATMPTTCENWVGYANRYTTPQFQIRTTSDATAGTGCSTTPPPTGGTGITLTTSPTTLDFNSLASGFPTGVSVYTAATATAFGTAVTTAPAAQTWGYVSTGFFNYASGTGLGASASTTVQGAATNRALGTRQTGTTDIGQAFVFQFTNTTGKTNFAMNFQLQSLDSSSTRTTTWRVDYGFGTAPTTFTQATNVTGTLTTGNSLFTNNNVNVAFGNALDNQSGNVWIRIVELAATVGSGTRATTGIDDVKFTWQ